MLSLESIEEFRATFDKVALETSLLSLETAITNNTEDKVEQIHEFFREIHSLKGTAGLLNFDAANRFLHVYEDVIDLMNRNANRLENVTQVSLFDFLLQGLDLVDQLIGKFMDNPAATLKDDHRLFPFYIEMILNARHIVTSEHDYFSFVELSEEIF